MPLVKLVKLVDKKLHSLCKTVYIYCNVLNTMCGVEDWFITSWLGFD